jgi:hypothetical protein
MSLALLRRPGTRMLRGCGMWMSWIWIPAVCRVPAARRRRRSSPYKPSFSDPAVFEPCGRRGWVGSWDGAERDPCDPWKVGPPKDPDGPNPWGGQGPWPRRGA